MSITTLKPQAEAKLAQQEQISPQSLVDDVAALVSPPDVCFKVMNLVGSEDSSANALAEVISMDPSLTARLLKIVNSAYYNFSRKIDTVSRAVMVIGEQELFSLVIAVTAVNSFNNIANGLVNMDVFWRHSLYTGLYARNIAKQCRILHPERLFIGGLLHDIGSLVMYYQVPDTAKEILMIGNGDEEVVTAAEDKLLGFSHADLGGLLAKIWLLPDELQSAIRYHHQPQSAKIGATEANIVALANLLANQSGLGGFCEDVNSDFEIPSKLIATVDPRNQIDMDALHADVTDQFGDAALNLLS